MPKEPKEIKGTQLMTGKGGKSAEKLKCVKHVVGGGKKKDMDMED